MMHVALAMVGIFAFYVLRTYVWQYNAKKNGVDAEAYVSWIQQEGLHTHPNGREYPMTYYYVRFQKDDGTENEARLLNPSKELTVGRHVRIRYLPWHDDVATLMEIENDEISVSC